MTNYILKFSFAISCMYVLTILACFNKNGSGNLEKSHYRLVIISPYGCYQLIEFDKSGSGILQSGLKDGDIFEKNVVLDTLLASDSFYIADKIDLYDLSSLLDSLSKSEFRNGNRKNDAHRIKVFIHDLLKIDEYGVSVETFRIFSILMKYLPLHDQCDFFKLLKESPSYKAIYKK